MVGEKTGGVTPRLIDGFLRTRLLVVHGWLLLWGGVLRWRLETFGLYMPSLPEQRPWWRVNSRMAFALLRQRGRYARWLSDMRLLSRQGPAGWWRTSLGPSYPALQAYLNAANSAEPAPELLSDAEPGIAAFPALDDPPIMVEPECTPRSRIASVVQPTEPRDA